MSSLKDRVLGTGDGVRVRCEFDDWEFSPRFTDGVCPLCGSPAERGWRLSPRRSQGARVWCGLPSSRTGWCVTRAMCPRSGRRWRAPGSSMTGLGTRFPPRTERFRLGSQKFASLTKTKLLTTTPPNGERGAQPTNPSPENQSTHAGPHTSPGTQTQPKTGDRAHRP